MKFCYYKYILLLLFYGNSLFCEAQDYITRDIKSFGAIGNGKVNDHEAFVKAADFFNKRGGNGKLVISKGVYLVGKQINTNGHRGRNKWEGLDVLQFNNIKNLTIEGANGAVLRYIGSMRFGSFDPGTGKARKGEGFFVNPIYAANLGHCIHIIRSENVSVLGLELDGNSFNVNLGGYYGDVGRQLEHYGIMIRDSRSVTVQDVNVHHFALDGIYVGNLKNSKPDGIKLLNSKFNYNARQGLSWGGGNELYAKNCQFNHTGKGKFSSAPGAGVDIEAEYGPIRNGTFEDCEFIDATGCCMVADVGDIANVIFNNCTFWSSTTWSIWTKKPGFTFTNCKIYGPVVHGYDSPNEKDATKFINCYFEDKPYNGKQPPEPFLIDTNHKRRMRFENCTVVVNYKKLFWINGSDNLKADEKYQIIDCKLIMNNSKYPQSDYYAVLRGANVKNTTFQLTNEGKKKGYYIEK